jgi:hypothetical protein
MAGVLNAERESMISNHACLQPEFQQVKELKKEGLPRDSPSIVFAAAVALIGRPPQRRHKSSYKAPAQDNETLDHLLSIVENKISLLANQPSLQVEFSAPSTNWQR